MSGGTYGNFWNCDWEDLLSYETLVSAREMAGKMTELGYYDAAKETLAFCSMIETSRMQAEQFSEELKKIWKAVEYAEDGDISAADRDKAYKEYLEHENEKK